MKRFIFLLSLLTTALSSLAQGPQYAPNIAAAKEMAKYMADNTLMYVTDPSDPFTAKKITTLPSGAAVDGKNIISLPTGGGYLQRTIDASLGAFQLSGDAQTDISAALMSFPSSTIELKEGTYRITQKTRLTNKSIVLGKNAKLQVDAELVLENCNIQVANPASIFGTGTIRGVLANDRVPVEAFTCYFNLLTRKDRSDYVQSGDLYVDPLTGEDANSGTSPTAAFRSLPAAYAKVQQLISQGRSTDLTVILRGGRYEFESTLSITNAVPGKRLIFRANAGDQVQFTPKLEFFNSFTTPTTTYGSHKAFPHRLAAAFFNLYRADSGEEIEIASSNSAFNLIARNYRDSVKLSYQEGKPYASIFAPDEVKQVLEQSSPEEIKNAFIVVKQWFTAQWSRLSSVNDREIKYPLPASMTLPGDYDVYVNGYRHYTGNKAPFFIGNLSGYATDANFFTTPTLVYLPRQDGVYFTSQKQLSTLLKITAPGIRLEGIAFAYVSSTDSEMISNYLAGMNANPVVNATSADDLVVNRCFFRYNNVANVYVKGDRFRITNNTFEKLGGGGVYAVGNAGTLASNQLHDLNRMLLHQPGLVVDGAGDTTAYNVIDKVAYIGIRLANTPSMIQTHICFRNIIRNVGCTDNGQLDETRSLLDGGAMYVFGRNPATSHVNTDIFENVIYNVYSEKEYRGIFCDDGVAGCRIHDNLIWNVGSYTIDLRQVLDRTLGNKLYRNILAGPVRFQGLGNNTQSNEFQANNVILSSKNGMYSNILENLSQYSFKKLDYATSKDVLYIQPDELKASGILIPAFIKTFIAPYTIPKATTSIVQAQENGLSGLGYADDSPALKALLTTWGSSQQTLHLDKGLYRLFSSVVIPENVTVEFDNGAVLMPVDSATITINGNIKAGLYKIIDGEGKVVLNKVSPLYPEWYGATGSSSASDYLALKKIVGIAGTQGVDVYLSKGTYAVAARTYLTAGAMNTDSNGDGIVNNFDRYVSSDNGVSATYTVDDQAQKIHYVAAGNASNSSFAGVIQSFKTIDPNTLYTLSVDAKWVGSGYSVLAVIQWRNEAGVLLREDFGESKTNLPSYRSLAVTGISPATAKYASLIFRVNTRVAGQTGDVWFRRAVLATGNQASFDLSALTIPSNVRFILSNQATLAVPSGTVATLNATIDAGAGRTPVQVAGTLNGNAIQTRLTEEKAITAITSNYTITLANSTILANASNGAFTITLPDAALSKGRVFVIKKIDASANTVTVTAVNSQNIDGSTTRSLATPYQVVRLQSDGTGWIVL